ncbi:hypothetical protein T484DRAFT_1814945 [Baffinella frigidus]|nr:hypothetical protein T484DRAFT_1814945 [Cryptophyta sp. CCMP2293]
MAGFLRGWVGGGAASDSENESPSFPQAERLQPSSFIQTSQPTGGSRRGRRAWEEGSWAEPSAATKRERSSACGGVNSTQIALVVLAAVAVSLLYAQGHRISTPAWLTPELGGSDASTRPPVASIRERQQQLGRLRAALASHRSAAEPPRGRRAQEAAAAGGGGGRRSLPLFKEGGGGAKSGAGGEGREGDRLEGETDLKAVVKLHVAEHEIARLDGKIKELERASLESRMKRSINQDDSLSSAEKEIDRLEKVLDSLQNRAEAKSKQASEQTRRIKALQTENEGLERGVMDKDQDQKEVEKLTSRVAELNADSEAGQKATASGETHRLKSKLKEQLVKEEHKVQDLMSVKVSLAAQLEAAKRELNTQDTARSTGSAGSAGSGGGGGGGAARGSSSSSSGWGDDSWGGRHRLGYASEVQKKEKAEERRISQQSDAMVDKQAEAKGLDPRHRRMLRKMEQSTHRQAEIADARGAVGCEQEQCCLVGGRGGGREGGGEV